MIIQRLDASFFFFITLRRPPKAKLTDTSLPDPTLCRSADRLKLIEHPRPIWRTVVEDALRRLGGEADLDRIYAEVEGRQPTGNRFWRDKIDRKSARLNSSH